MVLVSHKPKGAFRRFGQIVQKACRSYFVVGFFIFAGPSIVLACDQNTEMPRTILALYDDANAIPPRFTKLHRYAEMPLNYLGYRLIYHDLSTGLPELPNVPIAATISWFSEPVDDPSELAAWLGSVTDVCGETPAIMTLGHTGLDQTTIGSPEGAVYLARLGVAGETGQISFGALSTVQKVDDLLVGGETDFNIRTGIRDRITAIDPTHSHLSVQSASTTVDLLVLAPAALYADDSVLVREDPRGGALWSSDPFKLFAHALNRPLWPIPDTTTLSGRRLFFATVNSDGWLLRLPARQFGDQPPLAAEVLDSDLISPFPDLPISVAVLLGDLDPTIAGLSANRGREVAVHLLGLPHVQAATTGLSMILNWSYFTHHDGQSERDVIVGGTRRNADGGLLMSAIRDLGDTFSGYTPPSQDAAPFAQRKYAVGTFDLEAETVGAIEAVSSLAPENGTPPLFIWSGDAMPFSDAISQVTASGSENIGGGGGLITLTRPSISNLMPLGFRTEAGLQVYDALSGDAAYTQLWSGNISGGHALRQTLDRTETPRRLKPFQLSFGAWSAIDFATRSAVKRHLEYARNAEVTPVTAARYARAVKGFDNLQTIAEGPFSWRIINRGDLQTVRFDDAASLAVDLATSEGVIGARRNATSLYVALSPNNAEPRIALTPNDVSTGMIIDDSAPALIEARAEILSLQRTDCISQMTMLGFGDVGTTWLGAPNHAYDVVVYESDGTTRRHWINVSTDANGHFSVQLPLIRGEPTAVSIADDCNLG